MVYVDANVILELILQRPRMRDAAKMLGEADVSVISMLTVHLVWHFCRLENVADSVIETAIADKTIVDVTRTDYEWALRHEKGRDFEDALQVATALRSGCDTFLTFDRALARRYHHLPLNFKRS
jgi:predicted nucleic acid-binding protein